MQTEDPKIKTDIVGLSDMEDLSVPLWVFDIDCNRVVWANAAARALWHTDSPEDLYARDLSPEISEAMAQRLKNYQKAFVEKRESFSEIWTLYPDGKPCAYLVHFKGRRLSDGRMGMFVEAREHQGQGDGRANVIGALDLVPVNISIFSGDEQQLYSNAEATQTYGQDLPCLRARFSRERDYSKFIDTLMRDGAATLICQMKTANGLRWHEIVAHHRVPDAEDSNAFMMSEVDVTSLKEQERKVRYLADNDRLTGLRSRNYVNVGFPKILRRELARGARMALLLIDLDNFKTINDTQGHDAGDKLLMHVAEQIKDVIQTKGQIARLGGDEFVILAPFEDSDALDLLCETILERIASECSIGKHRIRTRASIGISLCPEHGCDIATMMQHADLALYEAKNSGRNTHRYFRPALEQAAIIRRVLEKDLDRAIEENQFELYYQPRVDCQTQSILAVEALMRWNHPERGLMSPDLFISTLEDTGMIHQVGDWIVEQAGTDQQILAECGHDIPISINISPKQFEREDFVSRMKTNLAKTKCSPEQIEIEITESMLMGNGYDARAVLTELRSEGFSIAIDDFGTGYSNLAYIQEYPISSLKVDRSFIEMTEDRASVVNLILSLCRLIHVTAIAEGVETAAQLKWLQLNHCDQYQGYLFAKPQPLSRLLHLLHHPPHINISNPFDDIEFREVS